MVYTNILIVKCTCSYRWSRGKNENSTNVTGDDITLYPKLSKKQVKYLWSVTLTSQNGTSPHFIWLTDSDEYIEKVKFKPSVFIWHITTTKQFKAVYIRHKKTDG